MRRIALPIVLLLLAACQSDQVTLTYGSQTGRRLAYRLRLDATIDRTLSGRTRRQIVEATFRAEQHVLARLPAGGASAQMTLRPEGLIIDGRRKQEGSPQTFDVTLGEDGRILDIAASGETEDPEDESLAPLGIDRLLPRLRPVLPGRPVSPGEMWRSESAFRDAGGRFTLRLTSRLAALGVVSGHDAALVRTTYASPVERREVFSNAVTDVRGEDVGTQEAWFSLEGFLLRSAGDSVGSYRLVFRPPGEASAGVAPVQGALRVRLHTDMRLLAA